MTTLIAEFTVVGTPVPQGSMQAFVRGGKPHVVAGNAGPLEKWRGDIRSAFAEANGPVATALDQFVQDGPVSMRLTFRLARPKSHYLPATKSRPRPELKADAPTWGGKGDLDKLVRAVLDALTGISYEDDKQVVVLGATKEYSPAGRAGVDVRVSAL